MSTFSIFVALIVFVCFLLVLVIMVQNPKGGGLSSSFGGGTQQLGGVQKTSDFLDRSTWVLATLLLALILVSNITLSSGNDTIINLGNGIVLFMVAFNVLIKSIAVL